MPIGSTYQDASLDGVVDSWPASGARWALFNGVPVEDGGTGVELSGSGYTSPSFAPADFDAASGQAKTVASPIDFGTSTDAYAEVGTHWAILDSGDALVYWDDLPDGDVTEVLGSGIAVTISPTIFFGG